ncbi:rhamnogalacturonan acetylesterase [uncultured Sunxiuqinia sp.]|uniref:rhamnogalacturonan acetylesterase n=1 Tax=uncultured Sunxiuqinia sp. TaxID=1573825 RepID=UPI002AA6D040|nr:rhamnogalacturonan acetylesterase [uncultured Sunxiuqinia sp.]
MIRLTILLILVSLFASCQTVKDEEPTGKPTVYIIGDSTVKHGRGDGAGGQWGWGDPIAQFFDTSLVNIENHALGGTSSRTYRTKGLWDEVLRKIQPGDYVLMQFGHNDNGPINDDFRARGTFKGISEKKEEIDNLLTGEHEVVHSYGWYLRQYIIDAKEKGATPVVMSPIPRNDWENGLVPRNDKSYGEWSKEVAHFEEVEWIDLNEKMAVAMEALGEDSVTGYYFYKRDHTHTTAQGALLAASFVVEGLRDAQECNLKEYLLDNPTINFPVKRNVFIIGDSTVANGDGRIVGWGRELSAYMDTLRLDIVNKARGGRSSRSYRYEGLWDEVLTQLNEGDFLLIQFGHNDGGNIDKAKYRGSLKGTGDETQEVVREDGTKETVHTYGWYMKKYIAEARAKGVSVIVLSQIPRNEWPHGKVERVNESYGKWAREAARSEEAFFIDLNNAVAIEYEAMGPKVVKQFFPGDHTHTNEAGARFNALTLAEEIQKLRSCELYGYVELK